MTDEHTAIVAADIEIEPSSSFDLIWGGAYASAEERLRALWMRLRDEWLRVKGSSRHTRRAYERASVEWMEFLAGVRFGGRPVALWETTSEHVRLWQRDLQERGLAASTINQRLAICSSWYSFVIHERGLVDGVEVSAFMDRMGRTRGNPFNGITVPRLAMQRYGNARVLTLRETNLLLDYLEERRRTLAGSRNYALLLAFLLTGYRNEEVVSMQWGNIRESRVQDGAWVFDWRGKGGKTEVDPFPARLYHAMIEHLQVAGRWPGVGGHDYIWMPLRVKGLGNLRNVAGADDLRRHISTTTAQRVLTSSLRWAGVEEPGRVRVHDLRHTFAHRFRANDPDLEKLRARLHHESLATTGIYARTLLDEPVDDYSEGLYRSYRSR